MARDERFNGLSADARALQQCDKLEWLSPTACCCACYEPMGEARLAGSALTARRIGPASGRLERTAEQPEGASHQVIGHSLRLDQTLQCEAVREPQDYDRSQLRTERPRLFRTRLVVGEQLDKTHPKAPIVAPELGQELSILGRVHPKLDGDKKPTLVSAVDGPARERSRLGLHRLVRADERSDLARAPLHDDVGDRQKQVRLAFERRVDGALRVAGALGHLVQRRSVKALAKEISSAASSSRYW